MYWKVSDHTGADMRVGSLIGSLIGEGSLRNQDNRQMYSILLLKCRINY